MVYKPALYSESNGTHLGAAPAIATEATATHSPRPAEPPVGCDTLSRPPQPRRNSSLDSGSAVSVKTSIGHAATVQRPRPSGYAQKYLPDQCTEAMGPNARVWRVYLDEAELNDRDMVEGWKAGIDVLLVFAGLFSAVVTTFVAQTSQKLDHDFGLISASLLTELISIQRAAVSTSSLDDVLPSYLNLSSPPQYTTTDVWVNGLWFTSLTLSLTTALFSVLIKQWIQHYISLVDGSPQERARIHHFRYIGLERWGVRAIVGILPVLLYAALFIFILGLVVFLQALKPEIAYVIAVIGGVTFILYIITNSLPLFYPQCPYKTPFIEHIHSTVSVAVFVAHRLIFHLVHQTVPQLLYPVLRFRFRISGWLKSWCEELQEANPPSYNSTALKYFELEAAKMAHDGIIRWLLTVSANPSVKPIVLHSLSGLHIGSPNATSILSEAGVLHTELIREFDRQWSTGRKFYKNPDAFINSHDFYIVEGVFRASWFLITKPRNFNDHRSCLNALNSVGPNLLLWQLFAAHHIHSSEMNQFKARFGLSLMSPISPAAEQHPDDSQALTKIFHVWLNCYEFYPEDTPISELYSWAAPLCRILFASGSCLSTWKALLPSICHLLPPLLVEGSFAGSLDYFKPSPETLPAINIKFCHILLSRAITELHNSNDPDRMEILESIVRDSCNGLEKIIWACKDTEVIAPLAKVLDELARDEPEEVDDSTWRQGPTYQNLFKAYSFAFIRAPPRDGSLIFHHNFRAGLNFVMADANWMRNFWTSLFDRSQIRNLSDVVPGIVHKLETLEGHDLTFTIINNAFDAFMSLSSVQHSSTFSVGSKQWPSYMQPLIRWMLDHVLNCNEREKLHPSVYAFILSLIQRNGFLPFICSSFLIDLDLSHGHEIVFGDESSVLIRLAEFFVNKCPDAISAWDDFFSWALYWSIEIHDNDAFHITWTRADFERYGQMADLVDHLMATLRVRSLVTEVTVPRFEEDYVLGFLASRGRPLY